MLRGFSKTAVSTVALALCLSAAPAAAQDAGDVRVSIGFGLGYDFMLNLGLQVFVSHEWAAGCRIGGHVHAQILSCGAQRHYSEDGSYFEARLLRVGPMCCELDQGVNPESGDSAWVWTHRQQFAAAVTWGRSWPGDVGTAGLFNASIGGAIAFLRRETVFYEEPGRPDTRTEPQMTYTPVIQPLPAFDLGLRGQLLLGGE